MALVVAIALTLAAVGQQLLLIAGLGGTLPGWQPWSFLLGAAPAWTAPWGRRQRSPWPPCDVPPDLCAG
ncbi:hypothetical protein ABZ614_32670 [Streptomyces sp. NPDC013178]|uniref:hypothetical protein n=1 Tax=Streptomyces sp. NPDC013178 TaxID=3155118 RepID=UPI0033FF3455